MSLSTDPIELAKTNLKIALIPYFKGKIMETQLDAAVNDALNSIQSLLRLESTKGKNGATVMTEGASTRRGDGFASRPRNL